MSCVWPKGLPAPIPTLYLTPTLQLPPHGLLPLLINTYSPGGFLKCPSRRLSPLRVSTLTLLLPRVCLGLSQDREVLRGGAFDSVFPVNLVHLKPDFRTGEREPSRVGQFLVVSLGGAVALCGTWQPLVAIKIVMGEVLGNSRRPQSSRA